MRDLTATKLTTPIVSCFRWDTLAVILTAAKNQIRRDFDKHFIWLVGNGSPQNEFDCWWRENFRSSRNMSDKALAETFFKYGSQQSYQRTAYMNGWRSLYWREKIKNDMSPKQIVNVIDESFEYANDFERQQMLYFDSCFVSYCHRNHFSSPGQKMKDLAKRAYTVGVAYQGNTRRQRLADSVLEKAIAICKSYVIERIEKLTS